MGVPLPGRWPRLTASAARRVRIEQAAAEALERALEQLRREQGLVEVADARRVRRGLSRPARGEPETIEKLRWLLAKAVREFGERRLSQLRSSAIAAWRMTIPPGHRFEATQALVRCWLARSAGDCSMSTRPSSGSRTRSAGTTEKRPFESWEELYALAGRLGPRHGPMVLFAAATGLRPGEWLALEHRDIDREARVVYVRRTFRNGRIKCPKTKASVRAVPLQAIALAALERATGRPAVPLLFPVRRVAATSTCTTSATATGSRPRRPQGSRRCDGSTICGTRSRPSRFAPASPPSTSPATWERAWR